MSLPFEYFKSKTYIAYLQKLKDDKLYLIIQEFYKELEKLNDKKNTQLKDLKKLCDETIEIIKKIRFILMSYKSVYYQENNYTEEREAINEILYEMDKIELLLKDLKTLKINTKKVNKLVNDLLIFIRLLSLTITELDNN